MANNFSNYMSKNIGTTAATLVTVASGTQVTIIGMTVANVAAVPITVDVYITNGGIDYYLIKGADVPVGGALVPVGGDQKTVLTVGNALKVKSSVATSADVILSVLNIT